MTGTARHSIPGAAAVPGEDGRRGSRAAGATHPRRFVALLYVIELVDQLTGNRLDRDGIRPLAADGLWGIVFSPLLHAGWAHLVANTVPALVLGFLVTAGRHVAVVGPPPSSGCSAASAPG